MSTTPATVINITRKRGDTYPEKIQVLSGATGTAVDVTGYTFVQTVASKRLPEDGTYQQFQITGTIVNGPQGLVTFSPNSTQANRTGGYHHDIQMTDTAGAIRTIATGRYSMNYDITK